MRNRDELFDRLVVACGYLAGTDMIDSSLAIFEALELIYGHDALRSMEGYRDYFTAQRDLRQRTREGEL
ncbi:hypothetical protein ACGYQ5_14335 [Burkholderia pseudomallei]